MGHPDNSAIHLAQLDPTGEVDLHDVCAVEGAVRAILDRQYAGSYDAGLLHLAMSDVLRAYRGEYPGLLRCDALYHDLRHSLEAALTMARLLDGHALSHPPGSAGYIDADRALLGVLLALFHDIGMLRRDSEARLRGAGLTPIHEERGVEFAGAYLARTTLRTFTADAGLIMATKLSYKMPLHWTAGERLLAGLVATADLMSQISDRCYLEKCRDFLFLEFSAFGMAGRPDSPYPDSRTLLQKTPAFVENFLQKRLDVEFEGVRRYLRVHMGGADPWEKAIRRNVSYLKTLLESNALYRLRRKPAAYYGEAPPGNEKGATHAVKAERARQQLKKAQQDNRNP